MIVQFTDEQKKIAHWFFESNSTSVDDFIDGWNSKNIFSDDQKNYLNDCKKYGDKIRQKPPTEEQHYVPRTYLKRFINPDYLPHFKLETLDVRKKILMEPQTVKKVCKDTYFYSVETWRPDFISQIIEDLFWRFENEFGQLYDWLVEDILSDKQIDEWKIRKLCLFICTLWMRGKYFRDQTNKMSEDSYKHMLKFSYKHYFKDEKELTPEVEKIILEWDYNLVFNNSQHIQFISNEDNIYWFANMFFWKRIIIYIATWERNFATSDNPVVEIFPADRMKWPWWIWFLERIHYFVLHPRILIEFDGSHESGKKIKRKRVDDEKVTYYNLLRSAFSDFMYSKSKNDFISKEYSLSQLIYISDLVNILGSKKLIQDKKIVDDCLLRAKNDWFKFENNYEMFKYYGLLSSFFEE